MIMVVAATSLLAGCGGADSPDAERAAAGTPANPVPARTVPESSSEGSAATKPGYAKLVQRQASKPKSRFTPCNLVTKAEAGAYLAAKIAPPTEAPLGPTCIYRSAGGKAFVTVAVQNVKFADASRRVSGARRLKVADRSAVCGKLDHQVLYVALAPRRMLSIAGPCDVARKFATTAVGRLDG
jgi:Protein of unknown function (DUF3558)